MTSHRRISKMFGALVLGGCFHQSKPANSSGPEAGPAEAVESKPSEQKQASEERGERNRQDPGKEAEPDDYCQLEFNLIQYARSDDPRAEEGGVEKTRTCLDEKSDEEILKTSRMRRARPAIPRSAGAGLADVGADSHYVGGTRPGGTGCIEAIP